jgi:hypothetical protein
MLAKTAIIGNDFLECITPGNYIFEESTDASIIVYVMLVNSGLYGSRNSKGTSEPDRAGEYRFPIMEQIEINFYTGAICSELSSWNNAFIRHRF